MANLGGGGGGNPAQGPAQVPVKTEDVSAPVLISFLDGYKIAHMINSVNPGAVWDAGSAHMAVSTALTTTAQNLIDHATVLSQNWSGQAAQNAMSQFQQLHDTAISLAQSSHETGMVLEWLGKQILPWYQQYRFQQNTVQNITNGEQVDILNRLNDRLVMANDNLPDSIKRTPLPASTSNGTPGTTNGVPNPGLPVGGPPAGGLPGTGTVNGGLPGAGQGGTVPGAPGTGTVPGAPGSGTGMSGAPIPGTTHTAGFTGSLPPTPGAGGLPGAGAGLPHLPGIGGGPGVGGLGPVPPIGGLPGDPFGGPGSAGLGDGAGAIGPEGAAAGDAAAMGAQEGAAAEGMAGMPMTGAGAGQRGEKERKRDAWMNEDDDIWGLNDVSATPRVIDEA